VKVPHVTPQRLLAIGGLLAIAIVFLNVSPKNPPGFYRDETAIAYNAYTLESSGRDEYGARFPLFIRSFGDYKSPLYVYLLAGVFAVTGPSAHVARDLSAVLGLAAVLALTYLAYAVTRRGALALAVGLLAGLSPYLFEISRLVFEVALEPLLIALFLLTLHRAAGTASAGRLWRRRHSVGLALLLGAMFYTYQAGRVFAPLFAIGVALCFGRGRRRRIAELWGLFAVLLVPFGVYWERHPGALSERYETVTWLHRLPWWRIVERFPRHYFANINLWDWAVHGDSVERHHVPGDGSLFFVEIGLALAGVVIVLLRRRSDAWWQFVVYALVVSPAAAALTVGSTQSLRLIVLPLVLPLLAIPALQALAALPRPQVIAFGGAILLVFAIEAIHWQTVFHRNGPGRQDVFEAQMQPVIAAAFAHGGTVYTSRDFHAGYIDTLFFGVVAGRPRSSIVVLPAGKSYPPGVLVVGTTGDCPTTCKPVFVDEPFEAYITPAPGHPAVRA
jgi:hypothetical protein